MSSYQESGAIDRHFLDSILPYEYKPYQTKQITKSKQFYKPQQCIWNNPHRTSSSIYKFYHKYNKEYETTKQPYIKKMEQQDRKNQQITRIRKLSDAKLETRKRFFNRKFQRENLEYLSGNRFPIASETQYIPSAAQRFDTISHYQGKPTKYESMITPSFSSKISMPKANVSNFEQSYLTGVQKSHIKKKLIQKLIVHETHRQQEKLRQNFQRQKANNNQKQISRISKFSTSKYQKSISCKQN